MYTNDLPINELALLYLEHHHDDLTTPEDYINAFNYVHSAMSNQLKQMRKEKNTVVDTKGINYMQAKEYDGDFKKSIVTSCENGKPNLSFPEASINLLSYCNVNRSIMQS